MPSADRLPRLLITGASGFLGDHLGRRARANWQTYGLWRRHRLDVAGVTPIPFDLAAGDSDALAGLLHDVRPDAVIHAAACSRPDDCESRPEAARRVNVAATEALARACHRRSIPFVFTSTDMVFDGRQAPYDEGSPVCPISAYGRQKAAAERIVRRHCPRALICRLPLLIGGTAEKGRTFSAVIIESLIQGRPLNLFVDEFRTPVDGGSAAAGILMLVGRTEGVVHLGGRTRISRYQMGCRLAGRLGCDPALIRPVALNQIETASPRPPDLSLDSRRAYAMGYAPMDLDACLDRMAAEADAGGRPWS